MAKYIVGLTFVFNLKRWCVKENWIFLQVKVSASGKEHQPHLVPGHLDWMWTAICQMFASGLVGTGWECGFSYRETVWSVGFPTKRAGAVLSITEGEPHCYDYHYHFVVTADFAFGRDVGKESELHSDLFRPKDFAKMCLEDIIL